MSVLQIALLLIFLGILIFTIVLCLAAIIKDHKFVPNQNEKKQVKGFINKLNSSKTIENFGGSIHNSDLEAIFNKAKNPWKMTPQTFQTIRYGGLGIFTIFGLSLIPTMGVEYGVFSILLGILCFIYPMYYYKGVGHERELEWNKMYEFIWVIKHNAMLYDSVKVFINTKMYIEEHAPHNKELIQGFSDFYNHWDPNDISNYIIKYYPFSVPREIYQIIFNMQKTGEFPEDSLNSLRQFIINSQDLIVEKTLSSVAGKATIYSLPFLMISVILALMIPLIMQILAFF